MEFNFDLIRDWYNLKKKVAVIEEIQERLLYNRILKRWDYPTEKIKTIKVKLIKKMEVESKKFYNIY